MLKMKNVITTCVCSLSEIPYNAESLQPFVSLHVFYSITICSYPQKMLILYTIKWDQIVFVFRVIELLLNLLVLIQETI